MRHVGEGTEHWYTAFRYRRIEREIATRPDVTRVLDLGCGRGENMWRFVECSRTPVGLDVDHARLVEARSYGPVVVGTGTRLPFAWDALDLVYAAHVLHRVAGLNELLRQAWRCLRPGGTLFLVESVEDHPLMRLGRSLHPWWKGDRVHTRLRFLQLVQRVRDAGFRVVDAERYSALFWLWEVLPERFQWMVRITPLFIRLEALVQPIARRWGAHGYVVAVRPETTRGSNTERK